MFSFSDAGPNRQAAFLANLETIDRIIAAICRRYLVPSADQEDFGSFAKLRLMEDDYAVFAKFQGRSSLTTYLNVVLTNYFRDFRTAQWGRWRPSAEARRLGTIALRLEALVYRDGCSMREAIEVLRSAGGELPNDTDLFRLASRLQVRSRVQEVGSDAAGEVSAPDHTDATIVESEVDQARARAAQELDRALQSLPAQDQVIVRMRHLDGVSVADIARMLGIQQKPLYRRMEAILDGLRRQLEERGVNVESLRTILAE
ncbi:MAG: RNA polymerase sigma factor [Longimicrobiales bacterium]